MRALELNVYHVAADPLESGEAVETRYLALLTELRRVVDIPVVMKLLTLLSSLPHFVKRLEAAGAAGLAFVQPLHQPDINLDLPASGRPPASVHPRGGPAGIRWIAILRGHTGMSLAWATGGVQCYGKARCCSPGRRCIRLVPAGDGGPARLSAILQGMREWMIGTGVQPQWLQLKRAV